jgi:hypothetical protein
MAVPSDYTEEEIAEAIEECGGYISGIAKRLGTSTASIGNYIKTKPALRDFQLDVQEELLDEAERGLRKAVYAEKSWAIQFVLARLGRSRGYGQKLEVQASVDSDSRVVVYLPDDGREAKATDGDSTATGATGHSATQ